jgi:hypothetical protein
MSSERRISSRDDRRILFTSKERNHIWEGLRERWNQTNPKHTKIKYEIERLMDEFSEEL